MRRLAFLLLVYSTAPAQPLIHRCVDADGAVSYQQTSCPADTLDQTIAIRADDLRPGTDEPLYAPEDETSEPAPLPPPARPAAPLAYLCVAADGTRFYRHDGCPAHLSVPRTYAWAGETPLTVPVFVPVQAHQVPRNVACQAIYARGADRREGAQHDERYTVYQRATGRDPCR